MQWFRRIAEPKNHLKQGQSAPKGWGRSVYEVYPIVRQQYHSQLVTQL